MVKISSKFIDKKVAVLGLGVEGVSAVSFLLSRKAIVHVHDEKTSEHFDQDIIKELTQKGVTFHFGEIGSLETYDAIVRSPGIPFSNSFIQDALARKQEVTSVTKIFFEACPCPIIGVTGTKGKGTTLTLIYNMLKLSGKQAFIGGNIGVPALQFLDELTPESIVVLELSSFQLIDLEKSPHIAVLLMVTSEHLDYHKDVMEYVTAKRNILAHQVDTDYAIINRDYPASRESDIYTSGKVFQVSREDVVEEGVYVKDKAVYAKVNGVEGKIIDIDDIKFPGMHNVENVMGAVMAGLLAGVSTKYVIQAVKTFKGLEHRLELVRTVKGVRYYNDSFSTTPETAEAAIGAFEDPKILVLGGSSKNSDFTRLGEVINESVTIKAIIGVGSEWARIKSEIRSSKFEVIESLNNMKEIVQKSADIAEPGDVVLLSPACASFDMFKDYKDRGNQFKDAVLKL